ncbi:MAG: nucleoside deaminase [Clostridia bacterium]|nr:nucleoside deaminase [Clostridia bacterium]
MTNKEKFMRVALKEAKIAYRNGEVPIGAVIVKDGEIISKSYNKRNKNKIATHHAEINAIEKACKVLGDWRLDGCEMYVTLEPCPMCAGAILNARISKVYFGAYEVKSGALLSNYKMLFQGSLNHKGEVEGGVLLEECKALLKDFFKSKRS